jgi:4-amino-4-deoxyprephenate dehydrogenase
MKTDHSSHPIRRTLVIGGLGQVGHLLAQSMRCSGIPVAIADSRPFASTPATREDEGFRYIQADVRSPSPELVSELRLSDCVCVCLPEQVTMDALASVLQHMSKGSLWVDTLSVKSEIARALNRHNGQAELLSLNPMFAPDLGWTNNAVAAVQISPGPKTRAFCDLISSWGARVVPIGAAEHDQLTAATQVATHAAVLAFGHCLLHLDFDVEKATQLATPPHRLLLGLLQRITQNNPEVYWDIQTWHPHAEAVRRQLAAGINRLQKAATDHGRDAFDVLFTEIKTILDAERDTLDAWARQLVARSTTPDATSQ